MNANSFGFTPAIMSGAAECFNPGGIVAFTTLFFFLLFIVRRQQDLWPVAVFFIVGNGLAKILLLFGVFDALSVWTYFNFTVACVYFLLASFSFILGGRLFRDGWCAFGGRALLPGRKRLAPISLLSVDPEGGFKKRNHLISGKAFFFGILLALLQSVWGQNENLVLLVMQAYSPGQEPSILLLLFVYTLVAEMPLILLAACMGFLTYTEKRREGWRRNISKVQLAVSAVFLAYGISFWLAYGPEFFNSCYRLLL